MPKVPDQSLGHGEYSVCLLALPTCSQVNWCLGCGNKMSQEHQMPSSSTHKHWKPIHLLTRAAHSVIILPSWLPSLIMSEVSKETHTEGR